MVKHTSALFLASLGLSGVLPAQAHPEPTRAQATMQAVSMPSTDQGQGSDSAQQGTQPTQTLHAGMLKDKGAELLIKARTAQFGIASEVLLKRADSNIQQAVRVKSGQGEWHRDDADILIGVEGSAQIILGGEIVNGKETAPGEIRGDGVKGGTTQSFKAGDYIRIEPQVAHQVLLAPGSTFRYMAVKVRVVK